MLDQRLEAHFAALRSKRDEEAGSEFPVFALEHGLSELELSLLATAVREAVERRHLPIIASLPFVVYATEVGYDYSGDEYWQTFSQRTPGWSQIEDRDFIRQGFQRFASRFRGAMPVGPWARHFSIICWPITHAVLPTDLQQQLVRLIFEYRTGLTGDLLADPPALGRRLAARTSHYSSRFRYFVQNTALLGQVAAALLSPENEPSPYLVDSTLQRIVSSLSTHHQAREWLRDAKTTANRVRTSGFRRTSPANASATGQSIERLPRAAGPGVLVQLSEHGWAAYLQLPDLSVLAEQLPDLHEQLSHTRVRLAGRASPLARGRVLVGDQRVPLEEWPDHRTPLLQFDGDSMGPANRLLADQCVLGPGPAWLFKIREPGLATEVRGKVVRPGFAYVLLLRANLPTEARPSWVIPAPCATAGVSAFAIQAPAVLDDQDSAALASLGIGVLADVSVRPAGVIPAEWDGEGGVTSLMGDDVVIAIESGRSVNRCIVRVDSEPQLLDWPSGQPELLLGLTDLGAGVHTVDVALLSDEADGAVAEGSLSIAVRTAPSPSSGGTPRAGLVLLADPPAPAIADVWESRAPIELLGPVGAEVTLTATLEGIRGTVLAKEQIKLQTPLDPLAWSGSPARQLRASKVLQDHYDEADVLILKASSSQLGSVELRCEREFSPLRWVVRHDRTGPYARLVDNTEGNSAEVTRFAFASPATPEPVDPGGTALTMLRWPAGGLLCARANDCQALVIMPPHVHGDLGELREALATPEVPIGPRTATEMLSLMNLCALWATASLPGDPFAEYERRSVLRALTATLVSVAAGSRWSQLEQRGRRNDSYVFQDLRDGVGMEDYQRGIADAISRRLAGWHALDPEKRAHEFGSVLATFSYRTHVRDDAARVAEFLLRAASDPSSLESWPADDKASLVEHVIVSPMLIRAARFVVLGIHLDSDDESGSTYRGWSWA